MNYIHLINQFWYCHKEHHFNPSEIALYFGLLNEANTLGWKNPFRQSNSYLSATVGITEPTMIRARNRLQQAGLIGFQSGKKKRDLSTYYLKNFSTSDSVSGSKSDSVSGSVSEENSLHNTKHKPNQTKDSKSHSPKRTVSEKPKVELSESAQKFAQWFRGLLPPDRDTTDRDLQAWAKTYDELVTIDKREKSEIKAVVLWARQNDFWQSNFLSATKLRHKDKTGTKYYDVFLNRMKAGHDANTGTNGRGANGQPLTPYQQRQHNGQRSVATLVENARDFAASLT